MRMLCSGAVHSMMRKKLFGQFSSRKFSAKEVGILPSNSIYEFNKLLLLSKTNASSLSNLQLPFPYSPYILRNCMFQYALYIRFYAKQSTPTIIATRRNTSVVLTYIHYLHTLQQCTLTINLNNATQGNSRQLSENITK